MTDKMGSDQSNPPQPKVSRRSKLEQDKLEKGVHELFEHKITFNEFLGFKVSFMEEDKVAIGFSMRPELIGHYLHGRLHGGVISSALDAVGGLAVLWATTEFYKTENAEDTLQRFAYLGTVDLRVDYLRQGLGEHFRAGAEVIRLGRRIASTRMDLVNEKNVLIASGSGTYIVS